MRDTNATMTRAVIGGMSRSRHRDFCRRLGGMLYLAMVRCTNFTHLPTVSVSAAYLSYVVRIRADEGGGVKIQEEVLKWHKHKQRPSSALSPCVNCWNRVFTSGIRPRSGTRRCARISSPSATVFTFLTFS